MSAEDGERDMGEGGTGTGDRNRYVVPDPADPPDGEPTTTFPRASHDDQQRSADAGPPTVQTPWVPPSPYPQSPPTAPPGAPGQVGHQQPGYATPPPFQQPPHQPLPQQQVPYQQVPHQHPGQQYAPQAPGNWVPSQPQMVPPGPQQARSGGSPGRGNGKGVAITIGVLIALLVAVGTFFGVRALAGGSAFEGSVQQCHIATDGTLTASGTVTANEAMDTTLEVRFDDANGGGLVDSTEVLVEAEAGEEVSWSATGTAGDDVTRVTCTLASPE